MFVRGHRRPMSNALVGGRRRERGPPFPTSPDGGPLKTKAGIAAALAAAMLLTGGAAAASADTYTVLGCAAGWEAHADPGSTAANACGGGGGLTAELSGAGPWEAGTFAYQRFTAPPGTRVARVTVRRTTQGMTKGTLRSFSYTLSADGKAIEACAPGPTDTCTGDLDGPVDAVGLDAGSVLFSFGCGADDPNQCAAAGGLPPRATLTDPSIVLRDPAAPAVARRTIADDGERTGRLRLAYDATDAGGGVYRTVVRVDGKVHSTDAVGGTCADARPDDADAYEFTTPVPCPATATRGVDLDVLALPLEEHAIEVAVEDAAGNSTTVYGPVVLPHRNGDVPGGSSGGGSGGSGGVTGAGAKPASGANARLRAWFVANHAKAYTSLYGRRVVVRGRLLTKGGRAVGGARLDVYHEVGGRLRRLGKTGLKTRPDGRLTLILPLNLDTRRIVLAYRAFRPGPITSRRTLKLTVRDRTGQLVRRVR